VEHKDYWVCEYLQGHTVWVGAGCDCELCAPTAQSGRPVCGL